MNDVLGFASFQAMRDWWAAYPDRRRAVEALRPRVRKSFRLHELWNAATLCLEREGIPPAADAVAAIVAVAVVDRLEEKMHERGGVGGRERNVPRGDR